VAMSTVIRSHANFTPPSALLHRYGSSAAVFALRENALCDNVRGARRQGAECASCPRALSISAQ